MKQFFYLLVGFCIGFLLVISCDKAFGDELGFGPVLVDGHSASGNYGINNDGPQSWGSALHFDKDLDWEKGDTHKIGLEPGAFLLFSRWTKNKGDKGNYNSQEKVNSYICGTYAKPYYQWSDFKFFGVLGPAVEFADDGVIDPALIGGGGIQYRFSDSLAVSAIQYEVWSDPAGNYRRFDATILSVDVLF